MSSIEYYMFYYCVYRWSFTNYQIPNWIALWCTVYPVSQGQVQYTFPHKHQKKIDCSPDHFSPKAHTGWAQDYRNTFWSGAICSVVQICLTLNLHHGRFKATLRRWREETSLIPRSHPAFRRLQYKNFSFTRGENLGMRLRRNMTWLHSSTCG